MVGGRLGSLIILIAGIVLIAVGFRHTVAYTAMGAGDVTMVALKSARTPSVRAMRSAIVSRDNALTWMYFAQPLADNAALYYELANRVRDSGPDSGPDSGKVRDALLDRSQTLHRNALSVGPARPYEWLRLALIQYRRDPQAAKLNPLLRLSYRTAPAEPQLALERIKLVYAARSLIDDDIRENVERDIRLVVRFRAGFLAYFARDSFAFPWLRERLRNYPDIEARLIRDYLYLP